MEENKYAKSEDTRAKNKSVKMDEAIIANLLDLGAEWKDVMKDYLVMSKVGEGSYGKVYYAKCKTTSKKVAIKHIDDFTDLEYGLIVVIRELKIMR